MARLGDAWLAGGTWLFSDKQPDVRRLIDLMPAGWNARDHRRRRLSHIGAMCTIADFLYEFGGHIRLAGGRADPTSCEAFLASFKVWNSATVGGNVCMSLPAGPMITLTLALEATYALEASDGSERVRRRSRFRHRQPTQRLAPGRGTAPDPHARRARMRKRCVPAGFTLTHLGRSTMFMIATQTPGTADLLLTITAGTTRPVRLTFDAVLRRGDDAARHRRDRRGRVVRRPQRHTRPPPPPGHALRRGDRAPSSRGPVMTYTVNGEAYDEEPRSRPVPAHVRPLARLARRSRRVATPATAARAPYGWTATRCTAASLRRSAPTAARSPRSRASAHPTHLHPHAAAVPRRPGLPVRILHRRDDHDRRRRFTEAQKADLPRALKGNLCRCTGYRAIEDAINGVAEIEDAAPGDAVGHQRRARPPAPTW